jgi:hypothetical protein
LLQQLLQPWALLQVELLQLVVNEQFQQRGWKALWATIVAARQLGSAVYAEVKCSLLQPLLQLLTQCLQDAPAGSSGTSDSSSNGGGAGRAAASSAAASSSNCGNRKDADVQLHTCLSLFFVLQGVLCCCALRARLRHVDH